MALRNMRLLARKGLALRPMMPIPSAALPQTCGSLNGYKRTAFHTMILRAVIQHPEAAKLREFKVGLSFP